VATPVSLLERLVHQRVEIRLKDQRILVGRLGGLDEHMNLVLDESEERTPERTRHLGRLVVRGSNIISLTSEGGVGGAAGA
jgi:small nuclear ribonucleoprotein